MSREQQEIVRDIAKDLIEKMGFTSSVEVVPSPSSQELICSIQVVDGQNFLIGQYGMNLAALQHLIRILVRRRLESKFDIIVDINNYYTEKKQLLEREAERAAEEALQKNISVTLRPMLPYERKIIHTFLLKKSSVSTESAGLGDERHVIVHPYPIGEEVAIETF